MTKNPFGCTSVEDVNIPEGNGNDFFKPEDGNTKIRFLAGPLVYYVSQKFKDNKLDGEKKYYRDGDDAVKKDKHAKLTFTYLIYEYEKGTKIGKGEVKQWDVNTKGLLKTIQALNELNPDLSLMDCMLTKKKGSNGYNQYNLVSGQNKPFVNKEVIELFINDNPFDKLSETIAEKIEETKNAIPPLEEQEEEIQKEIANNKEIKQEEVEDLFEEDELPTEEPKTTTKARDMNLEDDL